MWFRFGHWLLSWAHRRGGLSVWLCLYVCMYVCMYNVCVCTKNAAVTALLLEDCREIALNSLVVEY